jgi:hypothetical protein
VRRDNTCPVSAITSAGSRATTRLEDAESLLRLIDHVVPEALQRAIPLVARFTDICNTFVEGEDYERKSRVLDEHFAQVAQDPATIERSVLAGGSPEKSGEPFLR